MAGDIREQIKKLDQEGDHQKCIELVTTLMGLNPDESNLHHIRAHQLFKLEKHKQACYDAKKAAELGGGSDSYMLHGRCLFCLGKYSEAKKAFQSAIDTRDSKPVGLDPCAQWIVWCDDKMEKLNQRGDDSEQSTKNEESSSSPPTNTVPVAPVPKVKHDWYQTDLNTVITILIKNCAKEQLNVDINETTVNVSCKLPSSEDYNLNLNLCHPIVPDSSTYKILSTKIEIKLKKRDGIRWESLEGSGCDPNIKSLSIVDTSSTKPPSYPSSSAKKKDWNKIEADVIKQVEEEKPVGDAALNQLFQKIYADGSDEVRKAMNKSFSESGGTVLSTNWNEVAQSKVDVKPPDGLEYKKWS